jgi:hypothetical protein
MAITDATQPDHPDANYDSHATGLAADTVKVYLMPPFHQF